ncbi:calcium-dependent protein kinase 29 [Nymphaea colorata]|nr:calcium-dependent protein kinase 29 [Nymphaea colorata]
MEDSILSISKDMFVSIKKENINNYYEVIAKVRTASLRSWEREPSVPVSVSLYSLCSGGELFDRLDQHGSLSEKDARVIFLQMVEAINYLHLLKIAHRDLKPENFLFLSQDSNNIKLIDFGLAVRWENSLRTELKQKNDRKIVGTMSEKEVEKLGELFRKLDLNHDGFIEMYELKEDLFKTSNIQKLFKLLDKDGNGEIDREELRSLFSDSNVEQINGKSIEDIIKQCDKDKSGTISFEEFKQAIQQ